ncbi:MAG: BamA/TamA family outer membrane protein [Planctomycetia bacterium]|nr:BamA/TamA family outer membrane protein [Planctomycetia bacterium]
MAGVRFDLPLVVRRLALCLATLGALPAVAGAQYGGAGGPPQVANLPPPAAAVPAAPSGYRPPPGPTPQPLAPPRPAANVPVAPQVVDVKVEGNKTVTMQKIMAAISTRPGRPLNKTLVEEDVKKLIKTHWFVHVDPQYERTPDGNVIIIFRVVERPTIQYVKYYGYAPPISESTLAKKSGLKKGDALDPWAVDEAKTKLEEYYHSKAYAQATVTVIEGNKPGDRGVRFVINEGLKQKVRKVAFEGNTIATDARLRTQVQSKPPLLWLFKGEVDYDRINEDVNRLTDYYRSLGFFRARVGRELIYNEKQNWLTIEFVVDEGPRYVVDSVSVIGNTKIQSEALIKDLKLTSGNFFDQAKMTKDVSSLQDKYGTVGYIFADVQSQPRFHEELGHLDLVYKIEEGDRYRIGRIDVKIKGDNPHTRRTAVLNRLSVRTGDIANIQKIRDSEVRLQRSSMFTNNPAQGQPPKIVFARPGQDDEEEEIAKKPRRGSGNVRGQSPDPAQPGRDDELQPGESITVYAVPDRPGMTTGPIIVGRPILEIHGDGRTIIRGQSPADTYGPAAAAARHGEPATLPAIGQQPMRRTGPDASAGGARGAVAPIGSAMPADGGRAAPAQYTQPPANGFPQPTYSQPPTYEQPGRYAAPGGYAAPAASGTPGGYSTPESFGPPGGYAAPGRYGAPGSAPGGYGAPAAQPPSVGYPPAAPGAAPPPVYTQQPLGPPAGSAPVYGGPPPGQIFAPPPAVLPPPGAGYTGPSELFPQGGSPFSPPSEEPLRDAQIEVLAQETQTGRLMLGVGVNSNAGLVGNAVIEEQNFDFLRWPTSWEDIRNATAFRGAGQQFRIEAAPGTVFQRYLINFHNPYLFNTPVSFGLSGSYFTRLYQNWTEQRLGGRVSLGYQFLFDPNLSTVVSFSGYNVNISNPTVPTPPELAAVVGNNTFMSGMWQVVHDTRNNAFLPTQGHRLSIGLEEGFGSFTFPRATVEGSQIFLIRERPDTSGRHTLTLSSQLGFAGNNTPIYENFFAGGYTTLRGFRFRGASPTNQGVQVGGRFQFINSVEYLLPLTADDMLRAVAFVDFGTVEQNITISAQNFRVSPGLGLRVTVPALGPAPIALDFAVPVHRAPGDQLQLFSFFVGFAR